MIDHGVRVACNARLEHGDAAASIARAYLGSGDGFVGRLDGDFAFVLHDDRHRRVLAARDALGIRPLYYRMDRAGLRSAFDLRSLVADDEPLDEGFLAEVLAGDIVSVDATPYASIRRLPAGHLMTLDHGAVRVRRYWDPPRDVLLEPLDRLADRFRDVFDAAVRARAACDGALGVHVSGGLDSSSVLASVAANGGALVALSLALDGPEADEREWIAKSTAHAGVHARLIEPAHDLGARALAEMESTADLPDFPTAGPLVGALQDAARAAGAGAVLTGFGGDQWWTGEAALASDLLRRARIGRLAAWARAGASMGQLQWERGMLLRDGIVPLLPPAARRLARAVRPTRAPAWIAPRFAARVNLVDRLRARPDTSGAPSESWRRLRWRLESGEEAAAIESLHRVSAASGVELRHPFYDRELVALAFRMPPEAHIAGGRDRSVMRRAMSERLHPDVAARTSKADLSALLLETLRSPRVEAHRALTSLVEREWLEPDAARAVVARALAGDARMATTAWRLLAVEAWLKLRFRSR